MNKTLQNSDLLHKLYAGDISRNSDFELLSTRRGRRVHRLFKRLRALLREASLPQSDARLEARGDGERGIVIHIEKMGYARRATLSDWEAEFFLNVMGGRRWFEMDGETL